MLDRKSGSKKEFYNSTEYVVIVQTIESSSHTPFRIRLDFCMKNISNESDIVRILTYYSPLIDQGTYYEGEENENSTSISFFNQPDLFNLYYYGEIIYENGTRLPIDECFVDHPYLISELFIFEIRPTNDITISCQLNSFVTNLVVETSLAELPELMMIAEIQYASERIRYVIDDDAYGFIIGFQHNDIFQAVRINIPPKYHHRKLLLRHDTYFLAESKDPLYMKGKDLIQISQGYAYVDIGEKDEVTFFASRDINSTILYYIFVQYCDFDPETLFMNQTGTVLHVDPDVPTLAIFPSNRNIIAAIFDGVDDDRLNFSFQYNNQEINKYNNFVIFHNPEPEPVTTLVQSALSSIGQDVPYITIDFSIYKEYYDKYNYIFHYIISENLETVICEYGGFIYYCIYEMCRFEFTDIDFENSPTVKCSAVCWDNPNGVMCDILYPLPNVTGFDLIRYPTRDGISITGRGFLSELIPVRQNFSFSYYKSYNQSIQTIREYSIEEIMNESIQIKIVDNEKSNYTQFIRTRTICLYDHENRHLPFSRKHFDEDINSFLDEIGVSRDINFNFLINDEHGCIIFDPKYIVSNEFHVKKRSCDFYPDDNDTIENIDVSEMIFNPGGYYPNQKEKLIMIIFIICVVIVTIIIIIVIICILKKKCKSKKSKPITKTDASYSLYSEILGAN